MTTPVDERGYLDERGIELFEVERFLRNHSGLQLVVKESYRGWEAELYFDPSDETYWEKGPWRYWQEHHFRLYSAAKHVDIKRWALDIQKRRNSFEYNAGGAVCYHTLEVFLENHPKAILLASDEKKNLDARITLYFDPETNTYWEKGPFFWRDLPCVMQCLFKSGEVFNLEEFNKENHRKLKIIR